MRLKMSNTKAIKPLWLVLGMSLAITTPYAANFYTIIGPDGHPMIVQKPVEAPKEISKKEPVKKVQPKTEVSESLSSEVESKTTENLTSEKNQKTDLKNQQISSAPVSKNKLDKEKVYTTTPVTKQNTTEPVFIQKNQHSINLQQKQVIVDQKMIHNNASQNLKVDQTLTSKTQQKTDIKSASAPVIRSSENNEATVVVESTAQITQNSNASQTQELQKDTDNKHFTVVDGEKYVNNEYLEDQEFNLDGKKRFYMTPEVGAVHGRYETIERQKGLSASLLDRIRGDSKPVEKKAIVLAPTYYRLPQNEVVQNLEKSCFTGKKVLKAKKLSIKNQELGIWPTAPIKENFAYEVVELDSQVQNILLTSYASSSKVPSYYWPLVVFLDQQGCVIEGVSGFKNEEMQDNNLQFSAMEGVLRKPEKAVYMFLTPLSSAIDVENKQLTNHGQIKLSVIQ